MEFHKISINQLKPEMKKFWLEINKYYQKNKKSTTEFENLWDNLNYQNKITNQNTSLYKVVYNEAGTHLASAVVKKNILKDYTLLYYQTNNLDEAYYLCAIFNSNFINEQLDIIQSSRNFVKRPVELNIPEFNPKNVIHQKLSELGIYFEEKIEEYVLDWKNTRWKKIQNKLKFL
jgi:hypothetical protein